MREIFARGADAATVCPGWALTQLDDTADGRLNDQLVRLTDARPIDHRQSFVRRLKCGLRRREVGAGLFSRAAATGSVLQQQLCAFGTSLHCFERCARGSHIALGVDPHICGARLQRNDSHQRLALTHGAAGVSGVPASIPATGAVTSIDAAGRHDNLTRDESAVRHCAALDRRDRNRQSLLGFGRQRDSGEGRFALSGSPLSQRAWRRGRGLLPAAGACEKHERQG